MGSDVNGSCRRRRGLDHGSAEASGGIVFERSGEVDQNRRVGLSLRGFQDLCGRRGGVRQEHHARSGKLAGTQRREDHGLALLRSENRGC